MISYLGRRFLSALVVIWAVASITFVLLRWTPGGPFDGEKKLPPEIEKNVRAKYHLDESLPRQYLRYMNQLGHGDLGTSFKYPDRTVGQIIRDGAAPSALLGLAAFLVALGLGLPWGVLSALRRSGAWDLGGLAYSSVVLSLPSMVVGPLLAQYFGLTLGWLPVAGFGDPAQLILPALTLGLPLAAPVLRLTRAGMLDVLDQDFIRAARARGGRGLTLILRHALRGGLLPLVQFLGPATAAILTGTLVAEQIFWIPGLGKAFVQSVVNRDFTLILGTTLFYAAFLQVTNLLVDLATAWMDPRVRLAGRR